MASTTLTDYQVLMGSSTTLDQDNSTSRPRTFTDTFTWPSDLHLSNGSRRPMIMFNIHPQENTEFDLFLNGGFMIFDMKFNKSNTRNHFEVFDFDAAIARGIPDDKKLEFRITMKKGKARFSDIVIWYQINR